MQESYENYTRKNPSMSIQLVSMSPTQNHTLAIALGSKKSVLMAARVPWSQFMVPRREKGDKSLLGSLFVDHFLLLQKTI